MRPIGVAGEDCLRQSPSCRRSTVRPRPSGRDRTASVLDRRRSVAALEQLRTMTSTTASTPCEHTLITPRRSGRLPVLRSLAAWEGLGADRGGCLQRAHVLACLHVLACSTALSAPWVTEARIGTALRRMAEDLVSARRRVADLERENRD